MTKTEKDFLKRSLLGTAQSDVELNRMRENDRNSPEVSGPLNRSRKVGD
jgi:hypothetical protein